MVLVNGEASLTKKQEPALRERDSSPSFWGAMEAGGWGLLQVGTNLAWDGCPEERQAASWCGGGCPVPANELR